MIGRIIGNYRVTSELAHGGMGTVYRGQHVHLPREIVVKSILLGAFSPAAQSHLKARFRREAYIQSQLDHPNIVRVYEFFAAEDNYFMVMEYVAGMTLRELLSRQGVPTPAQAVYLCKQALSALDYAHNFNYVDESDIRHAGIIHRDIKPANLLLDNKGKLKITDFGIVKVMGEQNTGAGMTQTGFHPGTVEYMSPEQLLGLDIDARSDLYSLGVTFYEMLTGRLPFERSSTGSDWEVRKGHIEKQPPPILELRPDLPPTLAAIIMRALQKNPSDRFQTAMEFQEALNIHERTVENDPPARTASNRLTKSFVPTPTVTDEATTLVAKPSSKPFPPAAPAASSAASFAVGDSVASAASPLEEAVTVPIPPSRAANSASNSAPNSGSLSGAKRTSGALALPPNDEETKVAVRSSSKKKVLGLAAVGVCLLVSGIAAGAYLFSGQQRRESPQNISTKLDAASTTTTASPTVNVATPKASAKPRPSPTGTPVPTPAGLLAEAKALEDREQYEEAIAKYRAYQQRNPESPEAGLVTSRIAVLGGMMRLLAEAQADMEAKRYLSARERYKAVLRMKPTSKAAQTGFEEAKAKLAANPMQANPGEPFSPGFPRGGQNREHTPERRMPPNFKRIPKPERPPAEPDRRP
ncbi:MAG TPA: protein kinase [Blastocatellia bacterium]|nr:protein kinase [Blastocatellia bacterium]HMV81730.1 protein kinase [Blastocatellia bacterium]HMX25608.1 protein kinase [Blastocatellia bacterium]HMY74486.1 protein kinase [Blastocatellia bacterium]HMZ17826.1 protein kinase [Blastocatellia bacterium]